MILTLKEQIAFDSSKTIWGEGEGKLFFFPFSFLFWFQVYGIVVRQSYPLHSAPLGISSTPTGTIHSYCNIINCSPYALNSRVTLKEQICFDSVETGVGGVREEVNFF